MSLNLISPIIVLNNVSLATDQHSSGIHVMNSDNVGIQFNWTGTPTGVFGMDVCNDATLGQGGLVTGGTWTPVPFISPDAPQAAGSAGNGFLELNPTSAAFVRATYTYTSGSGNCTAILTAKPV